jgi:hypothetical protein
MAVAEVGTGSETEDDPEDEGILDPWVVPEYEAGKDAFVLDCDSCPKGLTVMQQVRCAMGM